MTRTLHTLHYFGDPRDMNRSRRRAVGIHFLTRRCEEIVDSGSASFDRVLFERTGVTLQIGLNVELKRIDEDRHHDNVALSPTAFHQ